jgi:hypothetical protein
MKTNAILAGVGEFVPAPGHAPLFVLRAMAELPALVERFGSGIAPDLHAMSSAELLGLHNFLKSRTGDRHE